MKILPVGSELWDADRETERHTGMKKLIVAFRNFANAPANDKFHENTLRIFRDFHKYRRKDGHNLEFIRQNF